MSTCSKSDHDKEEHFDFLNVPRMYILGGGRFIDHCF